MSSSVVFRSVAGRASATVVCSSRPSEQPRVAADAHQSRRSVLLGLGASILGLASSTRAARAAIPVLADLTRPVAAAIDANGDGNLDVDEIRGAMQRSAGISVPRETVVTDVMAVVDFDDDANISVDEFARGMALELEVDERWMRVMERDGGRGLSADELAQGLGDLGQRGREVVPVAFKMADADRDGRLNQEEAAHAMQLIAYGVLGSDFDAETGL